MIENRIKISSIVENQLPEFIREEYPLVSEFLSQYYLSLESQGSPSDIIQNIDRYIKVDNLTNLVEHTFLTSDLDFFDDEIGVESTYGFPQSYGLILIDDEIITYTGVTQNNISGSCNISVGSTIAYVSNIDSTLYIGRPFVLPSLNKSANIVSISPDFVTLSEVILEDDDISLGYSDDDTYDFTIDSPQFTGCIRGFNGITSLEDSTEEDQLVFKETEASEHKVLISQNKTKVINLSILFLKQFFIKIKKQITPGLENRDFYESLNENLFIKQSNNLYSSKGTESSFKILFGALYGVVPKIILPRDYLIQPSDAQFRITQDLVVESISGNPLELINGTLYQDKDSSGIFSDSRGTISDIKRISRGGKIFYTLSMDSGYDKDIDVFGSIKSNFKIHPKTKLTSKVEQNSSYLDVDSTIGFPNSGKLVVDLDLDLDGINETSFVITYTSKVLNQFLGCSGIILPLNQGTDIKIDNFAYGYNSNNEKITVRITGVISGIDSFNTNAYYEKGDIINIKTLGEDCQEIEENDWFFNISTNYDIESIEDLNPDENQDTLSKDLKIILFNNHSLVKGDRLEIFSSSFEDYSGVVSEINNSKQIIVRTDLNIPSSLVFSSSKIRKKISKLNVNQNTVKNSDQDTINIYKTYNTNVQNTYVDFEKSLYVTSPSLPSYLNSTISVDDFSYEFSNINLPENNKIITIDRNTTGDSSVTNHCYYSGDSIIFRPSSSSSIKIDGIGLTTSIYYVKVIDNNNIKLSRSRENIFVEKFVDIEGNLSGCRLELLEFNDNNFNSLKLKAQNLIKKISKPELIEDKEETDSGTIGIFVNGVELLNYKSSDKLFYGPIEQIFVTSEGDNYDVINPPNLVVTDSIGNGFQGYCSVIGELKRFDIIDPGFDYVEEPSITISGGNGSGAKTRVKTINFIHAPEFNSQIVNISDNTIEFFEPHKFGENEKVIYETDGQKSVLGLTTNSEYYVSILDLFKVKLHTNLTDAIQKINPVNFNEEGLGIHRLKSSSPKRKISSVEIISPGLGYQNKKTKVSKINPASDTLTIINHGYSSGEIILYYPQSDPIVGLTSSKSYYVTKISNNEIKLSEIGPDNDPELYYNSKQFINFTQSSLSNHYFNYPPITVTLNGKVGISSTSGQDYFGKIVPVFRGKVQSVFVENGGNNYGTDNIINFDRQPNIFLTEGSGAQLTPIVKDGSIERVIIQSSGLNYAAIPDIVVRGSGFGAILVPVISNGSISEVKVISGGFGYLQRDTFLSVINPGIGAKFKVSIKSWTINLVEKYILKRKIYPDDGIIFNGLNDLQYGHLYPSRFLRSSVYSKLSANNNNANYVPDLQLNNSNREINSITHSPIIGWAYDGNPIYGPYGFSTGNSGPIRLLKSGYSLKYNRNRGGRFDGPSIDLYPLGSFVEDYEFTETGDLDEYNGRYCITPEFPNGVYAYFSTFSENSSNSGLFLNYKTPIFPYVIGNFYKSKLIDFNINQSTLIDETYFQNNKLLRNTTPYNLLSDRSGYEFIEEPHKEKKQEIEVEFTNSGVIDSIKVINSGDNYKVNDSIIFDDGEINGKVTKIKGKSVSSIISNTISIDNFEFYPYGNAGEFIGISTIPHELYNNSLSTLTSKYEYKKVDKVKVIQNTLSLSENLNNPTITGLVTTFKVYGNLDFPVKENDFYSIGSEIIKILNIDHTNYQLRVLRSVNSSIGTSHSIGEPLNSLSRKVIFNIGITSDFYNYKLNDEYYFDPKLSVGLGLTSGVGITSTLFFSVNSLNTPVIIEKGTETTIYFKNQSDIGKYSSGGYVDIINSSAIEYNSSRKRIVSIGNTSIKLDFNTSSFPGTIITANLNKWNILNIPTKSIYLPNHKINTGDKLIYNSYEGSPISISTNGSNIFELNRNSTVYAVKLSKDLIGISTLPVSINANGEISGIGANNSIVYFSGIGTGVYHSFKTNYPNILKGSLSRNISTVSTQFPHGLNLNDSVYIDVESGISTTIKLVYNDANRRFTTTPKVIQSINLNDNILFVPNHNFTTGEKLIYNQGSPIGGLVNNKMYYAVIIDSNNIGLCSSLFESRKKLPSLIILNTVGIGTGTLSSINSRIEITKYQDIIFDVSDSSLSYKFGQSDKSAFELRLFYDENFKNGFGTFDVVKTGSVGIGTTSTIKLKTENLPNSVYYSLIPINLENIPISKKEIYIDKEQIDHNKISIIDSEISGEKKVIDYTSNTFIFETINPIESSFYDQNNSKIEYETNSTNAFGGISKVSAINKKKLYNKVPKINAINSETGTNAILDISTGSIGNVTSNNIIIKDIGFNYSSDITIRPKCVFPSIIRIKPFNIFESIEVISRGKNYISSPDLVVLDNSTNSIVDDVLLKYNIDTNKVIIRQNTKGIGKLEPTIIPVNNDNGFLINDIFHDVLSNTVTVILEGQYNDPSNFPFSLGDEILIENVSVRFEDDKGYNSEYYNYKFFKITAIDPNFGGSGANFTYSLDGLLQFDEVPGDYDTRFSRGTVIPKSYLPKFKSKLKSIEFGIDELIDSSNSSGIVRGWDPENNYLKVISNNDFFVGDTLVGQSSNVKAIIEDIISFNTYLNINSNSTVKQGWKLETGFLNNENQRIYDSDYYQYFSYSVESPIDINIWNDVVSDINHTSGFKKFSDLLIQESTDSTRINEYQDLGDYYAESISSEFINFNCVYDYDLVTENSFITNNKAKSNEIYFDSRILQDYIESIGNRVLLIDDISDKFTTTESRPYQIIDNFELEDIRYKKYFIYVYDLLDPTRSESLFVSLLHDWELGSNNANGFLNQYSVISSKETMGYFDFRIESNRFGQLLYYPSITERKIYKFANFSWGIGDSLVGINTELNIGDIAKIEYVSTFIPENQTTPITLPGISTSQRSCKILLVISDKQNSYYQVNEIGLLHDNVEVLSNGYGDLNNMDIDPKVTFSSSFENDQIVLKINPNVGIGSSLFVNAIITSIDSEGTDNQIIEVLGNIFTSDFISVLSTGDVPEDTLIFTHLSKYSTTYNNILIIDKTNNKFEFLEMNTLLNNSTQDSLIVEYGVLNFDYSIGKFKSKISDVNGNFEVYFTPYEDIDYEIRILSTILGIGNQNGVTVL
jgi:hypothetical protein